ncbi:hypothetical protein FRC18_003650 [Serendipita sp. 400]|nr:hypothetical protein FRC18_003650 [Serendipita sp. 400]
MDSQRRGATRYLLVHVVVKGSARTVLRSFSVTEDFEPGGQPAYFMSLKLDVRSAVEEVWKQLDSAHQADFNPINAVFGLYKCRKLAGASGWENYVLVFHCSKTKPVAQSQRTPLILCHLSKEQSGDQISLKHQLMVDRDCQTGGLQGTYDWLDGDWRKAAREQLFRINNYEPDMTKHPWALKMIYRNMVGRPGSDLKLEGMSLVLEWQECEPTILPDILAGQNNVTHGLAQLQASSDTNLDAPGGLPPYSRVA